MIYFDITDLLFHAQLSAKVTGIQRVVLEALKGLRTECIPFFLNSRDREVQIVRGLRMKDLDDLNFFEHFFVESDLERGRIDSLHSYLVKCSREFRGIHAFLARLDASLVKSPVIGIYLARLIWRIRMGRASPWAHLSIHPIGEIRAGDSIAVYGSAWRFMEEYERLFAGLPKGVKTQCFVHDLIPLVSPFAPDELREYFEWWIPFVLQKSMQVLVSSESCANDLRNYAEQNGLKTPKIVKIPLAHFFPVTSSPEMPSLRVHKIVADTFVLMVGTIEARKNHFIMLSIWEKFVRSPEYANQKLVIIGRWVWAVDEIVKKLGDTGNVSGSVVVIDDAADSELAHLYRHCRFTVYPSHYEGWGLPIGESLGFGKPCLHFDVASMREVGAGLSNAVPYPDYDQFNEAFRKLMLDSDAYGRQVRLIEEGRHKLRTWQDFARDVAFALK